MEPNFKSDRATIYCADCLAVLPMLETESVDAIVTDPPYGLSFMGKKWDYDIPSVEIWKECLRVLKPGGHLLAFAGTRTQHRMAVRIEDAGFEIRDMIAWVYGSGFPKSLDVSKAIDGKMTTGRSDSIALREVNETRPGDATIRSQSQNGHAGFVGSGDVGPSVKRDTPATEAARQWQGWGTALKPALEPITVARKPLVGTVAENVAQHGTGGININKCRVNTASERPLIVSDRRQGNGVYQDGLQGSKYIGTTDIGRWPANLIHSGEPEVVGLFPVTHGAGAKRTAEEATHKGARIPGWGNMGAPAMRFGDTGSAARFFYCAKASKAERGQGNRHPTVKPLALMRYLCRLVTPPGGVVLDPFMGSGSTGKAAIREGFRFLGVERDEDYCKIAVGRIEGIRERGSSLVQGTMFDED